MGHYLLGISVFTTPEGLKLGCRGQGRAGRLRKRGEPQTQVRAHELLTGDPPCSCRYRESPVPIPFS